MRDLALLRLQDAQAPALALGESSEVAVGDEIFAVGNPRGLEGTFSAGIISGIRRVGQDTLLQVTAPISPGSSGGPILNGRGEVIGVAVASFTGGQNLNFAVPADYLKALISRPQQLKPLSQIVSGQRESIVDSLIGRGLAEVSAEMFDWSGSRYCNPCYFSFTVRNRLRSAITGVHMLVVFYDKNGNPVDVYNIPEWRGVVPGGLSKRFTGGNIHLSVRGRTEKVEIRVLDFRFVE